MNQFYSNDGGATWEGPLDEQELDVLRQAGVITGATLLRSEEVPTAASSVPVSGSAEQAQHKAPQSENADIYLTILNERRGPFSIEQVQKMTESKQITKSTPMWRGGMSEWGTVESLLGNGIIGSKIISDITGLGGFEGFSFRRIIGGLFKHHTSDEATDFFCSGSSKTTPTLEEINPVWPVPWIFSRLILLSLGLYVGFTYMLDNYPNINLVPGFMFVGNFAIPFCVLILFAELNIQRNISFNRIVTAFLTGGFLSLFFTSLINDKIGNYEAYIAGPVEETAKLLAAIVIGRKLYDGRVLTGIVLGGAVGAGFAAFESAGYTFTAMLGAFAQYIKGNCSGTEIDAAMRDIMQLRGLLSPFAHVVWTAITAGAFWFVMGKKDLNQPQHTPFHLDCLADIRFLRIGFMPVVLHMLWNGMIPIFYNFGFFFHLTLGLIAWIIVLLLVQQGIRQIKEAKISKGLI